jgi:4-amino-4-deoxy-L-arabinose transferase-like glycosyltransferase
VTPTSGPPGRTAIGKNWGLWFRLSLACVAVLFLSFHLRDMAVNLAIPLDSDEAQYVGAARDYLETGRFLESTHNQSIPYFMPLGYPALIVLTAKLLHFEPHKAALTVNLVLGTLLPVLVLLFTWRLTESSTAALLAGVWAAVNWPQAELSAQAMTDVSYIVVFLLIAWLLWEYFWGMKGRLFWLFCLLLGFLFAAMYMIRVSAIYMLGAVPLVCLWVNWRRRQMPWRGMLVGLALFLALGLAVVLGNSLRWQQLNGYFTLSPQVAGNISIGNYESKGEYDLFRVHESGNTTVRRYQQRHGQTVAGELKNPLPRLSIMAENVIINLEFIWFGLWGWKVDTGLAGLAWALLALAMAVLGQRKRTQPGAEAAPIRPYPQKDRLWLAVSILGGLMLVHLLTYSVAVHFRRYMIQVASMGIILVSVGVHWLVWRVYQRHYPGRDGDSFIMLGLPAGEFVPKPFMLESGEGKGRSSFTVKRVPPIVTWGWMLLMAAVLGVCVLIWMQGDHSWLSANNRDHYGVDRQKRIGDYEDVPLVAQTMAQRAKKVNQPVRVAADSWSLAYYSHGTGFPVPYTEDRPEMLWRYLRSNRVNFVYGSNSIDFGSQVTGVPLYFILDVLAPLDQPWVVRHREGPHYQLSGYPQPKAVGKLEALGGAALVLEPDRLYLLHASFTGKGSRGKIVSDRILFELQTGDGRRRELVGDLCPGPDLVPQNLPMPLGNLLTSRKAPSQRQIAWHLYLAVDTRGLSQPRLNPLPQGLASPLKAFQGAVLYELADPGKQITGNRPGS